MERRYDLLMMNQQHVQNLALGRTTELCRRRGAIIDDFTGVRLVSKKRAHLPLPHYESLSYSYPLGIFIDLRNERPESSQICSVHQGGVIASDQYEAEGPAIDPSVASGGWEGVSRVCAYRVCYNPSYFVSTNCGSRRSVVNPINTWSPCTKNTANVLIMKKKKSRPAARQKNGVRDHTQQHPDQARAARTAAQLVTAGGPG